MTAPSELYERPSPRGLLKLAGGLLRARGRARRLALLNRARDYARLLDDPGLARFHRDLARILERAAAGWPHHDYGEGYLYQGLREAGITGLRDTEARMGAMGLAERLRGLEVLEVGCCTGFLALSAARTAGRVEAFDINPYAVEVAELARSFLGRGNAEFSASAFESFEPRGRFDAVLSFASHSTFDGNTTQGLEEYFLRCRAALRPGGLLLFESHQPGYEGPDALERALAALGGAFRILERRVLGYGTAYDSGRTFVAARPR